MFRNYLVIAVRNIVRYKLHSLINIMGLAISFAVSILIAFWVMHEYSYDKFHEHIDNIYLVPSYVYYGPQKNFNTGSPPALAHAIETEYPEVIRAGRLYNSDTNVLIQVGQDSFKEKLNFLDPALFDIFTFPFVSGDFKAGEIDPYSLVVSETIAKKLFGDVNPVGKTVDIDERFTFTITGVFQDIPGNSTITFSMAAPIIFLENYYDREGYTQTWYNCSFRSYALLKDNFDVVPFLEKLSGRCKESRPESDIEPFLYPYKDLYLVLYGYSRYTMIFINICLFIILIAMINFANLSTASALRRSREIGIRKIYGSSRKRLMFQFIGESILLAFLSLFISIFLVEFTLPLFNNLTNETFSFRNFFTFKLGLIGFGITLLTGLLAGIYPAFLLSRFNPIDVLKNPDFRVGGKSVLRIILVITQFMLSSIMFISLMFVMQQTRYMIHKNLGFDKENLVVIPVEGNLIEHAETWKHDLVSHPDIASGTLSSHLPTGIWYNSSGWDWEGRPEDLVFLVTFLNIDYDYLKTMDIDMKLGSFFSPEKNPQNSSNVVINEAFAEKIGVENPTGMTLHYSGIDVTVIGVVNNFNYKTLEYELGPLLMQCTNNEDLFGSIKYNYLTLRVIDSDIPKTIEYIEKVTRKFNPSYPFTYFFLDDLLQSRYRTSQRFMQMVGSFTVLALFISSLGLFGLASYMTRQRTREISIKKVLGASITRISLTMIFDFCKWVLLANILAWPIAWYLVRKFLEAYPYRIDIGLHPFMLSTLITFFIAALTVSWQTIRVAFMTTTKSLQNE